jgi:hypothetical protein
MAIVINKPMTTLDNAIVHSREGFNLLGTDPVLLSMIKSNGKVFLWMSIPAHMG